jgi:4-diphosphocytidyl-2-C-methyl-D-erythritol kinase
MVKLLSDLAPGKINLYLRVTGRRPDGYHELDSIFLPIQLCDRVSIEMRPGATRSITLHCETLPVDHRNLAFRAASSFMNEFGIDAQVLIDLHKGIPVGAGLGGGSSDAATVLRMLATICRLDDSARLAALALKLGADVPFFLNSIPARVGGIGERITPLVGFPQLSLVIAVPAIEVSTADIFAGLDPSRWSGPASADDVGKVLRGEFAPGLLVNDLAPVAMAKWPLIAGLKRILEEAGALAAAMTGSGGAVFGVFPDAQAAETAAQKVASSAPEARVFSLKTRQLSV